MVETQISRRLECTVQVPVNDVDLAQSNVRAVERRFTARANVSPVVSNFWSPTFAHKQKPSGKHLLVAGVRAVRSIVLLHVNCGVVVQDRTEVYSINYLHPYGTLHEALKVLTVHDDLCLHTRVQD